MFVTIILGNRKNLVVSSFTSFLFLQSESSVRQLHLCLVLQIFILMIHFHMGTVT